MEQLQLGRIVLVHLYPGLRFNMSAAQIAQVSFEPVAVFIEQYPVSSIQYPGSASGGDNGIHFRAKKYACHEQSCKRLISMNYPYFGAIC